MMVMSQVPGSSNSITEPGCGVTADVEGEQVAVGRLDWLQQQERLQSSFTAGTSSSSSSSSSSTSRTSTFSSSSSSQGNSHGSSGNGEASSGSQSGGQSKVYVAVEGQGVVGSLGFSDTLRQDAQHVVQELQRMGIQVMLISGNNLRLLCPPTLQAKLEPGIAGQHQE